MVADATAVRTELTRGEAGRLLGQTMALVAVTARVFALDAYLGRTSPTSGAGCSSSAP
jgi:hypothetical protein